MSEPLRGLLFLCVANSARSQMAEGLARAALGERVRVQSGGSRATSVHPLAVEVMAEIGIDIGSQHSKSVDAIAPDSVDTVITLCAEEVCPLFLAGARRIHWPIPDPASDDASPGSVEQRERFRAARDEIARRIHGLRADVLGGSGC